MKEEFIRAWDYLQKTSGLLLSADIIKKAHKIMMEDEKGALAGKYRKSPVFLSYRIFPPADTIESLVDDALYRYYHPTSRNPILAAADLFIDLIDIHPFEDRNRLCRMILSYVLMLGGCSLFPVLLGSFNKRGR